MGKKQSSSSSFWHPRRRSSSAPATPRADPPPLGLGCMSMVHYLIFAPGAGCVGRPPTSSNAVVAPRDNNYHHDKRNAVGQEEERRGGLEAPRNSLDLDADNLNDIPIGVQIEPVFDALACRKMRSKATAPSSEAETPRTPSLVARLMGIDGLPAQHHHKKKPTTTTGRARASSAHSSSPAASSSTSASKQKEKKKRVIPESIVSREPLRSLSCNVVSLPESPRGSTTSARASWDGARLSLQALRDNVMERAAQYMSLPTSPTSSASASSSGKKNNKNKKKDSNKQERITEIVRQAKEAVANRNKEKQSSPACTRDTNDNKENVMMSPVRKDKSLLPAVQERKLEKPVSPRVPLAPRNPPPPPPPQRAKPSRPPPPPPPITETPRAAKKPDGCERFATRIKKPAAATSGGTGCLAAAASPVTPPAPAAARSPPPCSSTSRGHVARSLLEDEDPEYGYLRKVLERGGFLNRNHRTRPFNPSSPVDPIVFHLLELDLPVDESRLGPLRHRWNRKLMFHLAQEILADLLLVSSPTAGGDQLLSLGGAAHKSTTMTGASLLSRVLNRVRSFPAANCRVVGDIDALVTMDLQSPATVRRLDQHPAVVDEATDVAEEVADQVLDTLLQELGLPEGGMTKESPFLSSLALLCNQRNPVT